MIDKLQNMRVVLIWRRDRIDAKIELLDQLLALEEGDDDQVDQESETQDGTEEPPTSDAPPSSGRVPRSPRAAQAGAKPRKKPTVAPVPRRAPAAPVADHDIAPTDIGQGGTEVAEGSNMAKMVDGIRGRAPHWVSHDGIVEAVKALGVDVPKTFRPIVNQACAPLRRGEFQVPGLQYRKVGRRFEYRILADGHELTGLELTEGEE